MSKFLFDYSINLWPLISSYVNKYYFIEKWKLHLIWPIVPGYFQINAANSKVKYQVSYITSNQASIYTWNDVKSWTKQIPIDGNTCGFVQKVRHRQIYLSVGKIWLAKEGDVCFRQIFNVWSRVKENGNGTFINIIDQLVLIRQSAMGISWMETYCYIGSKVSLLLRQ